MQTVVGIILRIYSHSDNSVILCTKHYGNIIARFVDAKVKHPGSIIHASLEKKGSSWRVSNIETVHSDHAWDSEMLEWYHHILELYYFYIPQEQPMDELFDQLYMLSHSTKELAGNRWRAFVLSFIRYTGEPVPNSVYQAMSSCLHDSCSSEQKKLIDTWIVSFIKKHPCYSRFNTKNILQTIYSHNVSGAQ